MNDSKPFHERVAEKLIAQLKAGTAPWQRPWTDGVPQLPMNPVTGKTYRGINTVLLLMQDHGDPRWMTYRQAQTLDAQVQKGEKGTLVQYWKFAEEQLQRDAEGKPVLDADGEPQKVIVQLERPRVFYAVVFNAEQIEGLPVLEQKPRTWDPVERAETILKNSGARIEHGGDRAFYSPIKDLIRLPQQGQFATGAHYYATALHELGHWTGHPERLDRDMVHRFGSEGYAREELRAEIASMIVGDELGLGHDPSQHAAYVGFWIAALEQDPLEIFRASSAAEKIRDFVLALEQQQVQVQQSEQSTRDEEGEAATMGDQLQQTEAERRYITVPYAERAEAKAAGARWDRAKRCWYVPSGHDLGVFERWNEVKPGDAQQRSERVYLSVPVEERYAAKAAGALWDGDVKSWYAGPNAEVEKLKRWIPVVEDPFAIFDKPSAEAEQSERGVPAHDDEHRRDTERTYLAVPYGERAAAKAAGALWDSAAKSWYVGAGASIDKLKRWAPERVPNQQLPAIDPREEFAVALRDMGFVVSGEHPIMNGQKHRLPVEGDRKGEKGGFYVAHLDGHPAGYVMNHRKGVEIRWKAKAYSVDPTVRAQLRAEAATKLQQRALEQSRVHEETAARLEQELARLRPATLPTAYMQSKGIGTHPGVYTDEDKRTYVPAIDAEGKLWTIQTIDAEGKKRFAKSSRKHGCFHAIGGLARLGNAEVLFIAEGYATAATIAEVLGKPAVAAFDAGNLLPVAQALRAKFPDKPIVIVADDDQAQEQQSGINPGRQKAQRAAQAVSGRVLLPIFAPGEQRDNPKAFSDFNDLAVRSVLRRDGATSQLRYAYEQALQHGTRRPEAKVERTRAPQKNARAL